MIATRHRPIESWNQQKLDLGGCVLYAQLWRPDMVARGGSIKNGTGTLDVSPQNLAVGVNTLTATGAGTFLISVPYTATCASGTATITGTPVTLNPGLNSVTTGVTTGTFTVTTSNIIRSKDSISHQMTITGALWTPQGRTFDGLDDEINCGNNSALDFINDFTIEFWIKVTTIRNADKIICRGLAVTDGYYIAVDNGVNKDVFLATNQAGALQLVISAAGSLSTTVWQHWVVTKSSGTGQWYLNGVANGASAALTDPTTSSRNFYVSRYDTATGYIAARIGEVRAYNRALTLAEIQRNYLSTRFRYQ